MTRHRHMMFAALAALGFAFGAIGPAAAQGTTSGPAVGGNVQPSATTQKKNPATHTGASGADASTGGVGVEAKKGSESGPAPNSKNTTH